MCDIPLLLELWTVIGGHLPAVERARLRLVCQTLWRNDAAFVSPPYTHTHGDLITLPRAGHLLWREYCRQLCEMDWSIATPTGITWRAMQFEPDRLMLRLYWEEAKGYDVLWVDWNRYASHRLSSFMTVRSDGDSDVCTGSASSCLRYLHEGLGTRPPHPKQESTGDDRRADERDRNGY